MAFQYDQDRPSKTPGGALIERLANVTEVQIASQQLNVLLVSVGEDMRNKIQLIGNGFIRMFVPDRTSSQSQQFACVWQGLHRRFPRRWRTTRQRIRPDNE